MSLPIADQIKCVARELALRKNVYRKRVAARSMDQEHADQELAAMESVMETLKRAAAAEGPHLLERIDVQLAYTLTDKTQVQLRLDDKCIVREFPTTPLEMLAPREGWAIRHADEKRWRTLDFSGMPAWTEVPAEALVCRLRAHAEAFAAEDSEDIRLVEVSW